MLMLFFSNHWVLIGSFPTFPPSTCCSYSSNVPNIGIFLVGFLIFLLWAISLIIFIIRPLFPAIWFDQMLIRLVLTWSVRVLSQKCHHFTTYYQIFSPSWNSITNHSLHLRMMHDLFIIAEPFTCYNLPQILTRDYFTLNPVSWYVLL